MATEGSTPRLMIVGPGELHDSELDALGQQVVAHFGDAWIATHAELLDALKRFLGCAEDPYILPGTGSLALEAAMVNLFEPGDTVVVPNTGFFGDRLSEIARAIGLRVVEVPVGIGEPAEADVVADAVRANAAVGVAVCQVDTSVATRNDIAQIASAASAAGAVALVDGIASVGGEVCDVDAMGLGCLVTGTQKGLESPPGLGVLALGPLGRERIAARTQPPSSWYLDLARWDWYRVEWPHHPHPVTMPASLMIATLSSLDRLLSIGLDAVVVEKHRLATRARAGLEALGLDPVARADAQAGLIVAAHTDRANEIVAGVLKEGIQIAGGLAPLGGKAIRIGIMGATATDEMLDRTLEAIGRVIER